MYALSTLNHAGSSRFPFLLKWRAASVSLWWFGKFCPCLKSFVSPCKLTARANDHTDIFPSNIWATNVTLTETFYFKKYACVTSATRKSRQPCVRTSSAWYIKSKGEDVRLFFWKMDRTNHLCVHVFQSWRRRQRGFRLSTAQRNKDAKRRSWKWTPWKRSCRTWRLTRRA